MKKLKSMPIVGGTQMGHPWLNPKNHASRGAVVDLPIATNVAKFTTKKLNAKHAVGSAANKKG